MVRKPFEKVLQRPLVRRFVVPFSVALAVVFFALLVVTIAF
jgi:hypothetical protein